MGESQRPTNKNDKVRLLDLEGSFFVGTDRLVKLHEELKKEERNEMKKKNEKK